MAGKKGSGGGAPKGNKFAVGNSGQPRQYDLAAEAADLLKWSERDDAVELLDWVNPKEFVYSTVWKWSQADEVFGKAFNKAKERIASRITKKAYSGEFYFGVYNRHIKSYDTKLHMFERQEAEYEAKLKAQEQTATSQEDIDKLEEVLRLMRNRQSDLNTDKTKSKTEHKSA